MKTASEPICNRVGRTATTPRNHLPRRFRILCVEDEPRLCWNMAEMLTRAGYLVVTMNDGQSAWDILRTQPFDLLVTDNEMPGLSGEELVAKLRRAGGRLPVIVASANPLVFLTPGNQWLQIAGVLEKPFPLRELAATVNRVLDQAALPKPRPTLSPARN